MEENKGCGCGCGCGCEEKEYMALQSQEDGSILLCKYIEKEDGEYEVEEIEDDEEFNKVSDAFDALVEEDDE